jgi:hypothetical protein
MAALGRQAFVAMAFAGALPALFACGGVADGQGGGGGVDAGSGSADIQMQLPAGILGSKVSYTITSPGHYHQALTVDVGNTADIDFAIDALPSAPDYALDVTSTSPDGLTMCTSSAQFGVSDMTVTRVALIAHCTTMSSGQAQYGSLQLTVLLPADASLDTLTMSLTGPSGMPIQRSWTTTGQSMLLVVIENVPVGGGDVIALTATSATTVHVCTASTSVAILPGATTKTTLVLQCDVDGGAGP